MAMAGLRAMRVYEEQDKACGVVLVLDMIPEAKGTWISPESWSSFPTADTVREMLRQTQYWPPVRNSHSVHHFLKMAIRKGDLEMVRLLLKHKVDIHCRIQGLSPLKEACRCISSGSRPKEGVGKTKSSRGVVLL